MATSTRRPGATIAPVGALQGEELDRRVDAVLSLVGTHFMNKSPVHLAAEAIARRLDEAGIDYAIAGALSLGVHGFVRATEAVDIDITRAGLETFKERWLGRGYMNVRAGGRSVRDTVHDVKIDFLIAGDFPGDGKPKPVSIPEPTMASVRGEKYRVIALPVLVELKLASGMTAPHRMQDLTDVMRLIHVARLPADFAEQIDPYVRDKFAELWAIAQHPDDD